MPDGVRIYLDGEKVSRLPSRGGLHLIQMKDGDGYRSVLSSEGSLPDSWLSEPVPKRASSWVTLSAIGGVGGRRLSTSSDVELYGERELVTGIGGLASQGWLQLASPWQVGWDIHGSVTAGTFTGAALLETGIRVSTLRLSLGALVQDLPVVNSDALTLLWLPMPTASLSWQPGPLDATVGGGASLAAWSAWARAGLTIPRSLVRVGVGGRLHGGQLEAVDDPTLQAEAMWWSAGLFAGIAFGGASSPSASLSRP